jgi:hypothetical protein
VSASANLAGNRVDLHKVKVSLAFPKARPATVKEKGKKLEKELEARVGYNLNPKWRAAYALCVADGRSREEDFKKLRLDPPEVTCIGSTDAFFPRGNGVTNASRTGRQVDLGQELEDHRRREELQELNQQRKLDRQRRPGSVQ